MSGPLPKGWAWSTIGEVFEINPRVDKSSIDDAALVSFVPMAAVAELSGAIDTSDHRPASELKPRSYRGFVENDVLIAKITPSMENGKAAIARNLAGGSGFGSTEFHVARSMGAVLPEFLLHYVLQLCFRADAARHMTGTAGQLRVPASYLRSAPIPVPPLAEQERIVAAIDQHLSAAGNNERFSGLGRLSQSLWSSVRLEAVSGDWRSVPLSDLMVSLRNGVFVSRPAESPPGLPIFRISAVRPLELRGDIRFVVDPPEGVDRFKVAEGDLLLTRYSGNPAFVGAAAVVPSHLAGILHPDKLIRVQVDQSKVLPDWVATYLSIGIGRQAIESRLSTTAGQVGISGSQLKTVPVAVPPIEYQLEAVEKLKTASQHVRALSAQVDQLNKRQQALRRTVLRAAFAGELVEQDAGDEPASVLLERIAAERAAAKKAARKPRTKTTKKTAKKTTKKTTKKTAKKTAKKSTKAAS